METVYPRSSPYPSLPLNALSNLPTLHVNSTVIGKPGAEVDCVPVELGESNSPSADSLLSLPAVAPGYALPGKCRNVKAPRQFWLEKQWTVEYVEPS